VPSPQTVNPQSLDGRFIGGVSAAGFIAFAVFTKASFGITLFILLLTCALVWIYERFVRRHLAQNTITSPGQSLADLKAQTLEELADTLPRAIVILDRNSKVIYANSAAFSLLSPNIIGQPIGRYLQTTSVEPYMEKAFDGKNAPTLSVHLLKPRERYIDVDFSRAVSIDPDNPEASVVLAVLADRTQSNAERELRADFLANASHELKTPIASMKGFIETLRGHAKDDPIAREKFLKIMAEQAERMERLVKDLLSLRRIESREHLPPSETADLLKAIKAARDALTLLAQDKGVAMSIKLPDEKTALTLGKTDECTQLFLNLMENAIKLSSKGSTLHVSLEHFSEWDGQIFDDHKADKSEFRQIVKLSPTNKPAWRVIITDEGPGISKKHLSRIGERFYRVAGDLPAQEKGTGLGLAIVKHITLRHRAGLYVKTSHADESNDRSHGTSFCVILAAPNTSPDLG